MRARLVLWGLIVAELAFVVGVIVGWKLST